MEVGGGERWGDPETGSEASASDLLDEHDGAGEADGQAALIDQCVAAVLAELARRSER